MNVLFVCTSNKDRSPALSEYFRDNYPFHLYQHDFRSAGINKYFCAKKKTHLITVDDIKWAHLIVYAESTHYLFVRDIIIVERIDELNNIEHVVLGLGEYKQGQIGEDYLLKAEMKIKPILDKLRR